MELITAFILGLLAATAIIFGVFFTHAWRRHHTHAMGWAMAVMFFSVFQVVICLPEVLGFMHFSFRLTVLNLLLDMTIVPVCNVMLLELTAVRENPRWYPIFHIVPFFLFSVAAIFVPAESSYILMYLVFAITAVYATGILIYTLVAIGRYNKRLRELYSDTENRDLNWLYTILFLLYALEMFWCIAVPFNFTYLLPAYYILAIITWSLVAYFMLKHQDSSLIIDYNPEESAALTPEQREVIDRTMPFLSALRQLEADETYFLTPGLTISDLAAHLGTNRSYLSEYLNKVCDQSFYDYINGIRIRHAAKLLLADEKVKVDDVMKASGFGTTNTFRKAFYAVYHTTPLEYRRQYFKDAVDAAGEVK